VVPYTLLDRGSKSYHTTEAVGLARRSATDIALSKPSEIAKRTAIFTAVGQLGSMFAGIMMTAMQMVSKAGNGCSSSVSRRKHRE
jgi:hypothetical protein